MPRRGVVCNRHARSVGRSRARACSRLYRDFCSGLSFLCLLPPAPLHSPPPPLHPTMVYLKCHEGEGGAGACARAPPDVGQQAVTGLAPACVAKPVLRVWVCNRLLACVRRLSYRAFSAAMTRERASERARTHVTPFSDAVPISGGTASRCIREYTRPWMWISNLPSLSSSPLLTL